jgi:hypothetical protein
MILTLLLIMPTSVCGETNDVGDVNSEYKGSGVSGVVGSVKYAFAGFVGIDRGEVWILVLQQPSCFGNSSAPIWNWAHETGHQSACLDNFQNACASFTMFAPRHCTTCIIITTDIYCGHHSSCTHIAYIYLRHTFTFTFNPFANIFSSLVFIGNKGVTLREGGSWSGVGGCMTCLVLFGVVQVVS